MRILLMAIVAISVPVELAGQDRQPTELPFGSLTAQVIQTVRSWAPRVPVLLDRSNPFNRAIPPGRTVEIEAAGQQSGVVSLTDEWQCGKSELHLPVTVFSQDESGLGVTELLAVFDRGPDRSAKLREIKTLSTS